MKKFLLLAALLFIVSGCSDDKKEDPPGGGGGDTEQPGGGGGTGDGDGNGNGDGGDGGTGSPKRISSIYSTEGYDETDEWYFIEYDNENNLSTIRYVTGYETNYRFTVTGNSMKAVSDQSTREVEFTLNNAGFIEKAESSDTYKASQPGYETVFIHTDTYTYDSDGYLLNSKHVSVTQYYRDYVMVREDEHEQNYGYTWTNGNLVRVVDGSTASVGSYKTDLNTSSLDLMLFHAGLPYDEFSSVLKYLGYFGKTSKNLLHSSRLYENDPYAYYYSYKWDNDKNLESYTATDSDGDYGFSLHFEYEDK